MEIKAHPMLVNSHITCVGKAPENKIEEDTRRFIAGMLLMNG